MTGRLGGKVALVTGAGSGVGEAIAVRFAAEGAQVAVVDIDLAAADEVAARIIETGADATALRADVGSSVSVERLHADVAEWSGRLDVLVNNAGVLDGYRPLLDTDEELWERTLRVNLTGMFLVTRAFMPMLMEAGKASVVNTASVAALVANGGGVAYTSSKHGVIGFTKQVAEDYGRSGVRANAILPGAVRTAMTRDMLDAGDPAVEAVLQGTLAQRAADPGEIANLALFVASDEAAFVFGAAYVIDGGWTVV